MPPKRDLTVKFATEEHFLQYYNEENKKLLVVDVHPSWSGPCELMYPTYKQISTTIDDFEKRMEFGLLDLDKLKTIRTDKDKHFQSICQPKFLFIMEGKVVDEVIGSNIPLIMEKIFKYVPLSL